jgi:anterior pharynx defective protein 1
MGAPGALGYALVALGPGAAFWAIFIAPKSFVSLLAVFSSFFWLSVMLATTAALRLAGAPARLLFPLTASSSSSPAASYAPVLIAAVTAEELARAFVAAPMHERAVRELQSLAAVRGEALSALDRLFLAFAWGFGHAACHALFLYAYALPLASGPGTLYAPQCPQMSAFMTGALAALGGGSALAAAAVVGLEAWSLGGDCSSSSSAAAALADAPHRASDAAAGEEAVPAAAPPPQTGRNLAARLRACPGSFARTLTAFLRSRRAWLSSPGWPMRVVFPPCLHLALALATLAALYPGGGCVGSSAAVLAIGVGAVVLAARRAIRLVAEEDGGGVSGGGRWAGEEEDERRRVVASPRAMRTMGGAAVANGGGGGGGVRHRSGGGSSGGGGGTAPR